MKIQMPEGSEEFCYEGLSMKTDENGVIDVDQKIADHMIECFGARAYQDPPAKGAEVKSAAASK